MTRPAISEAIERAGSWLLGEGVRQFPEATHRMSFPAWAGFTAASESQSSDVFARAVLGGLLLDIAEVSGDAGFAAELRRLARREADYAASSKLTDCAGGWSYFPALPELPPDADSLAAVMALFARAAPEHLGLCEEPLRLVLAGMRADGSFETWIVADGDEARRERMEWGVRTCWGTGADTEVVAALCHALSRADAGRHVEEIARMRAFVASRQAAGGYWDATWYHGRLHGTALALRVLGGVEGYESAVRRAVEFVLSVRRDDGCWGEGKPLAHDTAVAIWALDLAGALDGVASVGLADLQLPEGCWSPSPWIQMPVGRATGAVTRVATHRSATITTALCLRALLRV